MISRLEKNKKERKKIEKIEKKNKTKNILIAILKTFLITILILLSIFVVIRYIANFGIVVREYPLSYDNIPESFNGFKIVQFGDIYYNQYSNDLSYYIDKINELKPDLVIFSGGLKHKNYTPSSKEEKYLISELSKIKSSVGNYYVLGNSDDEKSEQILIKSNFKSIIDKTEKIYFEDNIPIILRGIATTPNVDYKDSKDLFKINVIYEPDLTIDILSYNSPQIIMAGKSINGQFRFPYLNGLIKDNGYKKYNEKEYSINDTKLFITGGLGTNNYPFRLFNHPSINFYRLMKKN